jgi:hypothetical protein
MIVYRGKCFFNIRCAWVISFIDVRISGVAIIVKSEWNKKKTHNTDDCCTEKMFLSSLYYSFCVYSNNSQWISFHPSIWHASIIFLANSRFFIVDTVWESNIKRGRNKKKTVCWNDKSDLAIIEMGNHWYRKKNHE